MLVITRKPGQSFTINDDVRIQIVRVSRDRVRVGIEAPKTFRIQRSEQPAAKQKQQEPDKQLIG